MPELRKDPVTSRWVIIARERSLDLSLFTVPKTPRPNTFCPFCYGNEDKTPPEILAYREVGTRNDMPGWWIRVIPNKFPALRIEGELNRQGVGMYDLMSGVGAHEVIIETPEHDLSTADLSLDQVAKVIWAYRDRSLDLKKDLRFRYILIFKNYGESAGASLTHSHSQLIATPVVPRRVRDELRGTQHYYDYKERCVFCDIVRQELNMKQRIIAENGNYLCFAPFASRFPFETWIVPKVHRADFTQIGREEVMDLAAILKGELQRLKALLKDPDYNYIIHTLPTQGYREEQYHWHLEVIPTLVKVAGFEWGSGFYINPTAPEEAARLLREVSTSSEA